MSRVFDALQEAARRSGANGIPRETVWKELGIDPATASPVAKEAVAIESPAMESAGDVSESVAEVPSAGFAEVVSAARVSESLVSESFVSESFVSEPLFSQPSGVLPMESLESEGAALLADSVPEIATKVLLDKKTRLIPHTADPIVLERYRMLRTKILQERDKKFFRSLVVTSPSPQEGKTVTVLNLALSFAALPSFKLLVIDGDMRRGTLGDWLGIERGRPGLSNLIEGSARMESVLLKSDELGLHIIPRGNARVSDLEPSQFTAHFRHLVEQFDLVLVDSPPVNLITDVQIMATSCDVVLLVARAFSTTSKSLEEAVDKLQSFRLIGTVLNGGAPRRSRGYHGYY